VKFVPLCAELTGRASIEFSSSRIADRLNEVINGRRGEQFSLTDIPAFIPRRLVNYSPNPPILELLWYGSPHALDQRASWLTSACLQVHRNGDIGAPRVVGSTNASNVATNSGAVTGSAEVNEQVLRELPVTQVQLDELWSFIARKQSTQAASDGESPDESTDGRQWVWVSFAPEFRLLLAAYVGHAPSRAPWSGCK
jgi:hypothetical protein